MGSEWNGWDGPQLGNETVVFGDWGLKATGCLRSTIPGVHLMAFDVISALSHSFLQGALQHGLISMSVDVPLCYGSGKFVGCRLAKILKALACQDIGPTLFVYPKPIFASWH